MIGICGCAVGLGAVFPRFACWYLLLNAALMLVVYVPTLEPSPHSPFSALAAVAAAVFLAGFGASAFGLRALRGGWWGLAKSRTPSPAST